MMDNNNNVRIEGCGCRFRNDECEYLCNDHRNEFILKLYNKDKNFRADMEEWLKIADAMDKAIMKDMKIKDVLDS